MQREVAPVAGPLPPITARTNLATVTYPVTLASSAQMEISDKTDETVYYSDAPHAIDQFSILLTRKNQPIRPGTKHLACFSRLNRLKVKNAAGKRNKQRREMLMKELRFAGIAFTGVEAGNGDGTPNMIASVIGGSHTVMSYNVKHTEPIQPGTMVRWTLPEVVDDASPMMTVPVTFHGASSKGVFAELEAVTPETSSIAIANMIAELDAKEQAEIKKHIGCTCADGSFPLCKEVQNCIKTILELNSRLQEREIGIVINDNGKGSIDLRLK